MSKIVCICGSTKFKKEMLESASDFTMKGWIVLMPHVFSHSDGLTLSDEQKKKLDQLHIEKIRMADMVFVVNKDCYVGESTLNEINTAIANNIPVSFSCFPSKDILMASQKGEKMSKHNSGIDRIAAERKRQIEVEGWTPEHDMRHSVDELVRAAAAYAVNMADFWPWSWDSWKPSDNQIRNLEKAGALIAAAIDRIQARGSGNE